MDECRVLEVKESIFNNNDERAKIFRKELTNHGVFFINVMSSPGSGKTTTLCALINEMKGRVHCGVMEADIDSDVDAKTIMEKTGERAIQLHTGGMCHLDADMAKEGMEAMGYEGLDVVFLENIGNLVCPAEFDTGAHLNLVILSVPEGDDKPLKYPLMFSTADVVLINKCDTLPVFDFDMELAKRRMRDRNPKVQIFEVSSLKGEGIRDVSDYLLKMITK